MKRIGAIAVVIAAVWLAAGCASSMSGSAYSRDEARRAQTVEEGTVVSVRQVVIEGTKTPVGAVAGGAAGGVLGSMVGSGKASTLGAVVGVIAGAAGGAAAEEAITREKGLEITVSLQGGRTISVVQGVDQQTFQPGDPVLLMKQPDGTIRVVRK